MRMRWLMVAGVLALSTTAAWAARQHPYSAQHRPGGEVEIVVRLHADADAVSETKSAELENMLVRAADRECPGGHALVRSPSSTARRQDGLPVAELRAEGRCAQ